MTHAALKDLLPCPFCGKSCAVLSNTREMERHSICFMYAVFCDATDDGCGATGGYHDESADAITAWNRRAALSAMEGEAVEWQYRHCLAPNGRILPEAERGSWGRDQCGWYEKPEEHPAYEFRALYTAPPPQQAAGKDMLRQLRASFEAEAAKPECLTAYRAMCEHAVSMINSALATQPQQAGGDDRALWGIVANAGRLSDRCKFRWHHVSDATGMGSTRSYELCRRFGFDPEQYVGGNPDENPSTPPQPDAGGGVTDAMVEAGARGLCERNLWNPDDPVTYSGTKRKVRNRDGAIVLQWELHAADVRAALEAALSTTHASGGEHG